MPPLVAGSRSTGGGGEGEREVGKRRRRRWVMSVPHIGILTCNVGKQKWVEPRWSRPPSFKRSCLSFCFSPKSCRGGETQRDHLIWICNTLWVRALYCRHDQSHLFHVSLGWMLGLICVQLSAGPVPNKNTASFCRSVSNHKGAAIH